jgi:hypothetical protein
LIDPANASVNSNAPNQELLTVMSPSPGAALLQILLGILLIGAVFGVVWWRPVLRHGSRLLGIGWVLSAVLLGVLGAIRATALIRRVGSPAARELQPVYFFVLYAMASAVVLAPPAIALLRRARRQRASSWGVIAASSAGWSLLGIVLAVIIALALDLANVPFVPGMQEMPRSMPNDTLRHLSSPRVALDRLEPPIRTTRSTAVPNARVATPRVVSRCSSRLILQAVGRISDGSQPPSGSFRAVVADRQIRGSEWTFGVIIRR